MRATHIKLITVAMAVGSVLACSSTRTPTAPTGVVGAPGEATGAPVDRGPVPPQPPPSSGTCDATLTQFAIGERASDALLERARIAAGADAARFIRPNQPITTEFNPVRLNLKVSAQEIVLSVYCG